MIYGLNGILGLLLADTKTIEEMELMASGANMMQGNQMQQKNFMAMFKAEKDYYEIISYKFALEDVEDAFLHKFAH